MELAALTSINTSGSDSPVSVESDGAGSLIDISALTTYDVVDYDNKSAVLSATNSGTIELSGQLTSLDGAVLTLDGTGNIPISQLTSINNGGIQINGGDDAPTSAAATPSNSFTNLSDISGSALLVSGGGSLSLPDVTSYQALDDPYVFSQYGNVFEVTGTNSTLSLPGLASISGSSNSDYASLTIEAQGGQVELAP